MAVELDDLSDECNIQLLLTSTLLREALFYSTPKTEWLKVDFDQAIAYSDKTWFWRSERQTVNEETRSEYPNTEDNDYILYCICSSLTLDSQRKQTCYCKDGSKSKGELFPLPRRNCPVWLRIIDNG